MITTRQTLKFLALSALALSVGMAAPAFAETTGHYIDDATITAKVKEAIIADSQLKVLEITVNSLHGTVALGGTVDTKEQEEEAVKVTKLVDGVAKVTDNMSVKGVSTK